MMDWDLWEHRDEWPVPAAVVAIEIVWYVARAILRLLHSRARVLVRRWFHVADPSPALDSPVLDGATAVTTHSADK